MIHFFGNFLQTTFVLCLSLVFVNIQLERKLCNLINYVNAFCYFVLSSMSYSNYLNRKKKVYQNGFWWYSLMVLINFFFFSLSKRFKNAKLQEMWLLFILKKQRRSLYNWKYKDDVILVNLKGGDIGECNFSSFHF